ncbi:MAG: HEAT repeat domain-containing protein [Planctomycetes bacterium]|nr:HEAT repeat domain-containing protein [Planctomycetota bacterium]
MNPEALNKLLDRWGLGTSRPAPSPNREENVPAGVASCAPSPEVDREIVLRGEIVTVPRVYAQARRRRLAWSPGSLVRFLYKTVSWAVSGLAHLAVAFLLAAFILEVTVPEEPGVAWVRLERRGPKGPEPAPPAEKPKDPEPEPEVQTEEPSPAPTPPAPEEIPRQPQPLSEPPPPSPGATPQPSAEAKAKEHLEHGRSAASRGELVRKYGGSEASESAVENGLEWLSRHQAESGEWDGIRFHLRCPRHDSCLSLRAPGDPSYTHGLTGLCILAFLGAGYSPRVEGSPYQDTLDRALEFLLRSQRPDGGLDRGETINLYNHAICTWALAESCAVTGDDRYGKAAERALEYLAVAQHAQGGWDYYVETGRARNDTSIAGWAIMAIRSAHIAGLRVPTGLVERAKKLIVDRTDSSTGELIYADRPPGVNRRGAGLVAVGLVSRRYLKIDDPVAIRKGVERLLANLPSWPRMEEALRKGARGFPFSTDQNMYAWYYGTLAMFHVGGNPWNRWNHALRDMLVARQIRDGHRKGSWEPETNYLGREGGRVFATAINVLNLEIYYRYLPLYRAEEKTPEAAAWDARTAWLRMLSGGTQGEQLNALKELVTYGEHAEVRTAVASKLDSEDLVIRWNAVKALCDMEAREYLAKLIEMANRESSVLKASMLEQLARFKEPSTVPLFLEALEDPRERVREGAVAALQRYSGLKHGFDKAAWMRWSAQIQK